MKEGEQRRCSGDKREDNEERGLRQEKSGKRSLFKLGRDDLQTCVKIQFWHHLSSCVSCCVVRLGSESMIRVISLNFIPYTISSVRH